MKHKAGIRQKVVTIICLSTLSIIFIAVGIGYFLAFILSHDMVGGVNRKLSQQLSGQISKIIDEEFAKVSAYSNDPIWKESALKADAKYQAMDEDAFKAYESDINARWAKAKIESALVREYLDNDVSAKLKALAKADRILSGISLIDARGGLVGASQKPENFIISYERWRAPASGIKKDRVFIGDVEFDEGLNTWVIPAAAPIKDESGAIIGFLRAGLSTERLFAPLADFRVDKTGHAMLVSGRGRIIFHPGISQINVPMAAEAGYKRLLVSKGQFGTVREQGLHGGKLMFVAFSEVVSPFLSDNGITWRVFIEQDAREVFAPLNRFISWIIAAVIFLLIIIIPIGYVFSGIIVKPIRELKSAVAQVISGNWAYKIKIKTGDEIEEFAEAFNDMVADIKDKQENIVGARNELEELSKSLEKKVAERTTELTDAKNELGLYTKKLERALMIKSDFISMASHELRTPLTAIKEGIAIISEGKAGIVSEKQKEFLDIARRNVDRLSRFINDILDLQKLEQGKVIFKMELNDINETAREVADTMRSLAENKKLQLKVALADGIPLIPFDKDKITQVIVNLLNNAIKFTEKGTVSISTHLEKGYVQVSVSDTGPGINEEDAANLFRKFIQLEEGLERKHSGTGLGLVICKYMIDSHKGKIWVESRPGDGATFSFILPVTERRG